MQCPYADAVPCGRCPVCIGKARLKARTILLRSFGTHSPNHFLTLKAHSLRGSGAWSKALRVFTQRLRRERREGFGCEYHLTLEFANSTHAHMLVRSERDGCEVKEMIRGHWQASAGVSVEVCWREVWNARGLARYVTKQMGANLPYGWSRRQCRLVWESRGFLSRPRMQLWREQVEEWYGSRTSPAGDQGQERAEQQRVVGVERGEEAERVQGGVS